MNRADSDPCGGVEHVAGHVLNDVLLAELEVVLRRDVLLELLEGLAPQISPVDQEQHPPGTGELDQAVDEVDRGKGLAATGRHLDQSAWTVLLE